jgi:hypothetical protein
MSETKFTTHIGKQVKYNEVIGWYEAWRENVEAF